MNFLVFKFVDYIKNEKDKINIMKIDWLLFIDIHSMHYNEGVCIVNQIYWMYKSFDRISFC